MATFVKTPAGTWKGIIRKRGWPTTIKTFRTKRDATDWARRAEDEMVRGVYIDRVDAERLTLEDALKRYLNEVAVTKRADPPPTPSRTAPSGSWMASAATASPPSPPRSLPTTGTSDWPTVAPTIPSASNSPCSLTPTPSPSKNGALASPTTRSPISANPPPERVATAGSRPTKSNSSWLPAAPIPT